MSAMNQPFTNCLSVEAAIDEEMDQLVDKLVQGTASAQDRYRYQELSQRRAELLVPETPAFDRLIKRRRATLFAGLRK